MNQQDKINNFLRGKKKESPVTFGFKNSVFGRDWYLSSFWEKTIFVLGFFALLWTIFKLVILRTF
jgi:hypothetical protein